ncbi:hypothetical protein [Haloarcula salinisoli]|uniref:Uncharacterized protein n=1 Tax=Haloarcula salinisoli TaxID=2487746 RepID=A0A8J7YM51_9EURY|nr:hypothetical protein [Halomicroarcula salinisoli]MBX0288179.1 hypothetical protein [Halomicroarcula salinisoli]MBX0305329.1 hypothetical protein [Halomicroarcula salinisoli]
MSSGQSPVEQYVETVAPRLGDEGFERSETTLDEQALTVFHDREVQPWKLALVDTVIVVGTADTPAEARAFSKAAFEQGLSLKSRFPRGLFGGVVVYPVIVTEAPLVNWVNSYSPRHWSSFEFPVVVAPEADSIHYNRETPTWGAVYYRGLRNQAERLFAP